MPKKKIEDKQIEKDILEILDSHSSSLSIKKIRDLLEERYNIRISPQVTKRYLLKLTKEGKIIETK